MEKSFFKRCHHGQSSFFVQLTYNIGLLLSQILSVILLGDPDETVSSRTGKAANAGKWWFVYVQEPFINFLFQDKNHCQDAVEEDEGCKQLWDWSK